MTDAMANIEAPGPFQSTFSMLPAQCQCAHPMRGANHQADKPNDGTGGEGRFSHSTMLTRAERAARIKEPLRLGEFPANIGKVQMHSTVTGPSDSQGPQQTSLIAAISHHRPMWLLHRIKSADVHPLCRKVPRDYARQVVALAGSISDGRNE